MRLSTTSKKFPPGWQLIAFLIAACPLTAQSPPPNQRPDLVLQTGHIREVTALRFSPDGRHLASSESGQTVKLWDVRSGLEVRSFVQPQRVEDFCFSSRGGGILATATSDDGGVGLWGLESGVLEGRVETGESTVRNLACSPDGRWLATSGGPLHQIKIWDLGSGEWAQTFEGFFGGYLGFTSDSRSLVASDFSGPITFWELGSWRQTHKLETRREASPAVDRQGRNTDPSPAITQKYLAWANKDGSATLWDIARSSGRILPGEGADLVAVALSPDGSLLATATLMGKLRLLDTATGRQLRVLTDLKRQHGYHLAFNGDGSLIVANLGGDDGHPRLWDAKTGRELHTLERRSNWVTQAQVTGDGRWLSATPYGQFVYRTQGDIKVELNRREDAVQIWDLMSGQSTFRLPQHPLYSTALQRWLRVGDGNIQHWDGLTGRLLETVKAPFLGIPNDLAVSADGRKLAVANYQGVKLLELPSLRELLTVHQPPGGGGGFSPREQPSPRRVWFSPKGTWLVSRDEVQTFLWDAASGKRLHAWGSGEFSALAFAPNEDALVASGRGTTRVISLPEGSVADTFSATGADGAVSPDGTVALAGYGGEPPTIWNPATGLALGTLKLEPGELISEHAVFSPDGRWAALALQSSAPRAAEMAHFIALVDTSTWKVVHRLRHPGGSRTLAFSADGKHLMTAGGAGIRLWDTASGSELRTYGGEWAAALSGDGRFIAGEVRRERVIRVWDAGTGEILRSIPFPTPTWSVQRLALSGDGQWLAAAGYERGYELRVWARSDGNERHILPLGKQSGADHLHFTSDGKRLLASSGKRIHQVALGTAEKGQTPFLPYEFGDRGLGFSGDGRWYYFGAQRLKTVDVETGRLVRQTEGPLGGATAVAVSSLGIVALAGGTFELGEEGASLVRLWDLKTKRELRRLRGHAANVSGLAFTADGRLLFSASQDGSARLWDVQSGETLAIMPHLRGPDEWLVVTPDGLFDGSADAFQRVAWRFAGNAVTTVEPFFNDFYHPGLLSELLAGQRPKAPAEIGKLDRRQPDVRIAAPRTASGPLSARTAKLVLQVAEAPRDAQHAAGSGARDLRLFRNGSLVKLWRGDVLADQPAATLEIEIPIVSGVNRFTAYAFNRDNIKSADAELVLEGAPSLKRPGTAYIVAIGINQYANPDYRLNYAVPDAEAFAQELRRQQQALGSYGHVEVVLLLDRDATRANLLMALARLAGTDNATLPAGSPLATLRRAEPEDAVFVYYAGHGTAAGPRFYLIPHDLGYAGKREEIDQAGLRTLLAHSLSDRDLERAFEGIDAGRLLLVIDACNSGQALEAEEKRRGPMNSKGLAQLAYEKGMYILTAAQGYQAALEVAQLGHGLLTYALVEEALKTPAADGAPKDGQIVMREWLDYTALRVPRLQTGAVEQSRKARGQNAEPPAIRAEMDEQNLQRPRVFYRREPEAAPPVVARVEAE